MFSCCVIFVSVVTPVDEHGGLAILTVYPGKGVELTKPNLPIVFQLHGVTKDLHDPGCSLNSLLVEITKLLK